MPEVIFAGPEGRLEGRFQQGKGDTPPVAIVLHPHPLFGGTMNNKVCYELYHMFLNRGFSVLRFNFRGVGRSQGEYDHGQGELADAATALDYVQQTNPNAPFAWVAGFSFGSWIAMQLLMRRPEIVGFICGSTPATSTTFLFSPPARLQESSSMAQTIKSAHQKKPGIWSRERGHKKDARLNFLMSLLAITSLNIIWKIS